ncbi:ABC transporter ATP-binding protein [Nakamurella sp.]|uniref:ABC transporter ATP-binding protein n=1 Tax=Nakamurella sp. TaxID=1869182 RepID=UPI003B3A23FF
MTTTPTPVPDGAAVRLTGLHKTFGEIRAVRGVDLLIAPGEVVAVLGPNGAGKSTSIDMLLGLTRPDAGTVRLFGVDPVRAVQAGRVGAMLQAGALLPDVTVKELVTMFAGLHRHSMPVADAIDLAGVTDIAGQKTQKLSGGQAQRVRFALALTPDPDLLVLDEPTAAMDVEVRRSFWASMRRFTATGRTVLFATHYLEEADQFADRVVVLAGGVVVADGTGAQIKARVGGRTVSAVVDGAEPDDLAGLPGVLRVDRQATRTLLHCGDSDGALRALMARYPQAHDIEIAAGNLEDAFLELVATSRQETAR